MLFVMLTFLFILLGLCFGSFVNALVYRLHEQDDEPKAKDLSILKGRSMCPNCKHELAAKDLIPVLSWVQLRGKCRYCGKRFDDTPVTELLVPILFVFSYVFWPSSTFYLLPSILFGLWLALIVGFVALAIYDIRWYLLPNKIVFPLQAIAGVFAVISIAVFPDTHSFWQLVFGLVFSAGLFWAIYTVSKGKWIGFGDVKLAVVIGLILGRGDLALLMLFVASALGSLIAIPMLITGKANRSTRLPFGPFLIFASIVTYLFGSSLIAWYTSRFLIF